METVAIDTGKERRVNFPFTTGPKATSQTVKIEGNADGVISAFLSVVIRILYVTFVFVCVRRTFRLSRRRVGTAGQIDRGPLREQPDPIVSKARRHSRRGEHKNRKRAAVSPYGSYTAGRQHFVQCILSYSV